MTPRTPRRSPRDRLMLRVMDLTGSEADSAALNAGAVRKYTSAPMPAADGAIPVDPELEVEEGVVSAEEAKRRARRRRQREQLERESADQPGFIHGSY